MSTPKVALEMIPFAQMSEEIQVVHNRLVKITSQIQDTINIFTKTKSLRDGIAVLPDEYIKIGGLGSATPNADETRFFIVKGCETRMNILLEQIYKLEDEYRGLVKMNQVNCSTDSNFKLDLTPKKIKELLHNSPMYLVDDYGNRTEVKNIVNPVHRSESIGVTMIAVERDEQMHKHGWKDEGEEYKREELLTAAMYTIDATLAEWPRNWIQSFKDKIDNKSHIDRLVVAGALIAAEIDRLIKKEQKGE